MPQSRGRVTERTFYPALIDVIRDREGTGVSEVTFNTEPDIIFKLLGRDWLLGVKIDETPAILKSAFIQYHRHREQSGYTHGLLLFLPLDARAASPTQSALANAVYTMQVTCLVDTPDLKEEFRGGTFPQMVTRLINEIGPKLEQRAQQAYSLPLVISLLQQQVKEMMNTITLTDPAMLKIITDRDLLAGVGQLSQTHTDEVGRFLASYIVLSQVLFLRLFASARPQVLPADLRPVTHRSLREAFRRVLEINYRDIYEVDVLDAISEEYLRDTFDLIWGLEVERVRHELPGRIFHELMPHAIRKMLAAFYTRPHAADILAQLTIAGSGDIVFDPACGSGTILVSAYRRKLELSQQEGKAGNPHKRFIEHEILGADVMPFAVHLTGANLAAMDPTITISRTQIIQGDSLTLIPGLVYRRGIQLQMFPTAREDQTTTMETSDIKLGEAQVVLMNPPFTKVERGIQKYVDMTRFRNRCGGEVGLWGHFLVLADAFLAQNGVFGGVIPISLLRGRESSRVRDLVFSEWTPLYILKPTFNYGFSEWSEYRDILFIARKGSPPPGHRVKFCLVKKDLTQLGQDDSSHIAQRIQALDQLRGDDLDIQSYSMDELREHFVNLMWFCSVTDFCHRDALVSFVEKSSGCLRRFPPDCLRTGYRPDRNVSSFLFLTRDTHPSRTEQAFLTFHEEERDAICARSTLGVEYVIEKDALVPSLRTGVGLRSLSIQGQWDYIAGRPYKALRRVLKGSNFRPPKGFSWQRFWQTTDHQVDAVTTQVAAMCRFNPFSPNTHLIAFGCDEPFSPSDLLNVVKDPSPDRAKALCVLFNSSLFLAQFFLLKEETTGRYLHVRLHDLYEMSLYPDDAVVPALVDVYNRFSQEEFPALREQLDQDFDQRYDEFWKLQRTQQPSLFSILSHPVRPSQVRLDFDLAVCQALGVSVTADDLREVYGAMVKEMIVTRGLQRD
jgi:hypothetical protein